MWVVLALAWPRVVLSQSIAQSNARSNGLARVDPSVPRVDALTLEAAEVLLQLRNHELQAARRAVDAARADVITAGARPNPNLTLGVSSINPQQGFAVSSRPKSARIDQLIERGNKRELRISSANYVVNATTADLSDTLRQQRLTLIDAYYDLALAQDRTVITAENIELFKRSLAAANQRLKAGDVAAADVTRLQVDALRAQNDARQAEADRIRAQIALAYVIGVEADADRLRAVESWPSVVATERLSVDEIVEQRPDVRAARARIEAAQSNRELARAQRTRDVSVGAQYDRVPSSETNSLGAGTTIGISVTVPLFVRYYFEGEIARAEADYSTALDAAERVRALARAELARAYAELIASTERLRRFDEGLLVEAKRSADYTEFAYKNGAIGVIDLLDARRVLRATQLEAAQARADYAKALAVWRAGVGFLEQ